MHFPIISLALTVLVALSAAAPAALAVDARATNCYVNITFNTVNPARSYHKLFGSNAQFNITNHSIVSSITKSGTECDPVGCYFYGSQGSSVELYNEGTVDINPPQPQISGQCFSQAG